MDSKNSSRASSRLSLSFRKKGAWLRGTADRDVCGGFGKDEGKEAEGALHLRMGSLAEAEEADGTLRTPLAGSNAKA